MAATAVQLTSAAPEPYQGFGILDGSGIPIGGFLNIGDTPEDADALRKQLHELPPGNYWLITVRRGGADLKMVEAAEDRVTYVPFNHVTFKEGAALSETGKETLVRSRKLRLLMLRVPQAVIDLYVPKTFAPTAHAEAS